MPSASMASRVGGAVAGSMPDPMTADGRQRRARRVADHRFLLRREEQVGPRQAEERRQDRARADQLLVLGGRHQHGAIGDEGQAEPRRRVAEGEEQDAVEVPAVRLQIGEEPGQLGAVEPKPAPLLLVRRDVVEHPIAQAPELVQRPLARGREPVDGDRPVLRRARREHVGPGHVVGGAAGGHRHVVRRRQPLGDGAAQRLRPAGDLGPIALDDAEQLHAPGRRSSSASRALSRA